MQSNVTLFIIPAIYIFSQSGGEKGVVNRSGNGKNLNQSN